ncbi:hypothetical protein HDU86_005458 [Geranomyces michiganensis]|nr:hypothetical protein HDU86_005458 [Geranomyces michiganensis]
MIKDTPLVAYTITPALDTGDPTDSDYIVTWLSTGATVRVRSKNSTYHGKGLFCAQPCIPKGTLIDHYHGYTMTSAEAHKKFAENEDSFSLHSSDVVVPFPHTPGRFCNDSVILPDECDGEISYPCPANAQFQQKNGTVTICALSDIAEGEEIIVNYGLWYWRGVLFERAGFLDAPSRFQRLDPGDASDNKTLAKWLKTIGLVNLPDHLRLVKVPRFYPDAGKKEKFDYYLVSKGSMGIWRSGRQFRLHMNGPDPSVPGSVCACEVCQKEFRSNNAKRKRTKDDNGEDLASPPLPMELPTARQVASSDTDDLSAASGISARPARKPGRRQYALKTGPLGEPLLTMAAVNDVEAGSVRSWVYSTSASPARATTPPPPEELPDQLSPSSLRSVDRRPRRMAFKSAKPSVPPEPLRTSTVISSPPLNATSLVKIAEKSAKSSVPPEPLRTSIVISSPPLNATSLVKIAEKSSDHRPIAQPIPILILDDPPDASPADQAQPLRRSTKVARKSGGHRSIRSLSPILIPDDPPISSAGRTTSGSQAIRPLKVGTGDRPLALPPPTIFLDDPQCFPLEKSLAHIPNIDTAAMTSIYVASSSSSSSSSPRRSSSSSPSPITMPPGKPATEPKLRIPLEISASEIGIDVDID